MYLLDTNIVSLLLRNDPSVRMRIEAVEMASLGISAVTMGELEYGLARRPAATKLRTAVREFVARVDVYPWTAEVASTYGRLRARLETTGVTLSAFDVQIAAHAAAMGRVLVSNDHAFVRVPELRVEDWTRPTR